MAIGTPTERYAQSLAAQTSSSVFSPATQIDTGRMAFVFITMGGAKSVTTITDSVGNTWTKDAEFISGGPSVTICSCQVTATVGTGATITVNVTPSTSSAHQIWIQEVTGLATSSALDKTEGDTQVDAAPASGALATLSQADEIIFGLMRTNTASTWTKGAAFTDVTTPTLASPPSALEYTIVVATTGINVGGVLGTAGTWAMVAATYKGAASAAPTLRTVRSNLRLA